jgi:hypothetical protein
MPDSPITLHVFNLGDYNDFYIDSYELYRKLKFSKNITYGLWLNIITRNGQSYGGERFFPHRIGLIDDNELKYLNRHYLTMSETVYVCTHFGGIDIDAAERIIVYIGKTQAMVERSWREHNTESGTNLHKGNLTLVPAPVCVKEDDHVTEEDWPCFEIAPVEEDPPEDSVQAGWEPNKAEPPKKPRKPRKPTKH